MLTFGSCFSGIGGGDRGLELAGARCAWQIEIDPACTRVLGQHWPDVPRHGDICAVDGASLEPVDVIVFGSPCQDLSVAGKRAGLGGERSGLFYEAIRLVRAVRPAFVAWENVPGALSSNRGRDFAAVLDALAAAGALDIGWRILDAQWFGVAQRRRRLFVVADFRGERAAQVLFEPESGSRHPAPRRKTGARIAASLTAGAHRPGVNEPGRHHEDDVNLVVQQQGSSIGVGALPSHLRSHDRCGHDNLIVAHALSAHGPRLDPNGEDFFVLPFDTTQVTSDKNYSTPRAGDPCHPLAAGMHAPAVASGPMVRRLTPRECERLQGFPDDWTAGESDSTRYRMLGNAMAVPCLAWLGHRLMEAHRG